MSDINHAGARSHGAERPAKAAPDIDPLQMTSRSRAVAGQADAISQFMAERSPGDALDTDSVHQTAAHGVSGSGGSMPHLGAIQASFGRHDVTGVSSHVGGRAAEANSALGSQAYATGNSVAYAKSPDLHTAAHEAAHVVQQRSGVQLKGGVGREGDPYERHADAVADAVVAGRSAEGLLSRGPGGGGGGGVQHSVQFDKPGSKKPAPKAKPPAKDGVKTAEPQSEGQNVETKRLAAKLAMEEWKSEQFKLISEQGKFEDNNWVWYLSRTSLNPYLTMSKAWYLGLAAGAVTAVLGAMVPTTAIGAKIGAMIGTAGGPVGTVVGAVIGFVLGAIAGWVIGLLTHSPDSAAADAAKKAGKHIETQLQGSGKKRSSQFAKVESAIKKGKGTVDKETDGAKLDLTKANFEAEKGVAKKATAAITVADRSLGKGMLDKWVLQHAGDEEDQGKGTSQAQWDAAADGTGLRTDGNIKRPDLFIHQTEAHLSRTGLRSNFFGQTIGQMKKAVGGSKGKDQQAVDKSGGFNLTAAQALKRYQKRSKWTAGAIGNSSTFEKWYLSAYRKNTGQSWVSDKERRDIRSNKVHVECFLDLTTSDGACYVNEWEYRVIFPSVEAMGWLYDGDHSFDISPD